MDSVLKNSNLAPPVVEGDEPDDGGQGIWSDFSRMTLEYEIGQSSLRQRMDGFTKLQCGECNRTVYIRTTSSATGARTTDTISVHCCGACHGKYHERSRMTEAADAEKHSMQKEITDLKAKIRNLEEQIQQNVGVAVLPPLGFEVAVSPPTGSRTGRQEQNTAEEAMDLNTPPSRPE